MSEAAYVQSRAEIEAFRAALIKFSNSCQTAVDELNGEIRLLADWLDYDRPAHWKAQIRLRERHVHDAKLALERCLIFRVADERPMCQEERVALRKAKSRLASAEEKAECVRHWRRQIQSEHQEMEGRLGRLVLLIEAEIPKAISALDRILDRLEAYGATGNAAVAPPAGTIAKDSKR